MVVQVFIGYDCAPKREVAPRELFERVVQARKVEALADEWQAKDPSRTFEQIFITRKAKDRDGSEKEVDVSLAQLKWEVGELQNHLGSCSTCKANVASERFKGGMFGGFGCFVQLPSPIPKAFEEALIVGAKSAFERHKVDPAIEFLHSINKNKVTGASIAQLRNAKPKAMESPEPLSFTYGGFLGKKTVTTDQIMEALLSEKVDPQRTLLYHRFLENTHDALVQSADQPVEVREQVKKLSSIFAMAAELGVSIQTMK
jgi:hypothetical protein